MKAEYKDNKTATAGCRN